MKTEEVYQKLKDSIIYGQIRPGDTLTVGTLADQFDVSKTPVRESLQALIHEGFIDVLPYKGYVVTRFDVKVLRDLFQMRTLLEGAAVELAAIQMTAVQRIELCAVACGEREPQSGTAFSFNDDKETLLRENLLFHLTIARFSGNDILFDAMSRVLNQLQRVLYLDLFHENASEMRLQHAEIAKSICAGDVVESKNLMICHIATTHERLLTKGGGTAL